MALEESRFGPRPMRLDARLNRIGCWEARTLKKAPLPLYESEAVATCTLGVYSESRHSGTTALGP